MTHRSRAAGLFLSNTENSWKQRRGPCTIRTRCRSVYGKKTPVSSSFLVSIDCEKEKKLLMGGTVMWGDASKPCGPSVCRNGKPGFNKIQQLAL